VEALSSFQNPAILVIDLEPDETTLPRMGPFTVNWVYYRYLLRQALPGNPTITSAEETDAAITIYTSTTKSAKNASELYHTYPTRDLSIPDSNYSEEKESKEKHAKFEKSG
jgi:hypothetical protein